VPDIATRNLRVSKLLARLRKSGQRRDRSSRPVAAEQQCPVTLLVNNRGRLTLPENWGQICAGRWDFYISAERVLLLEIAFMRCSSRPLRAKEIRAGHGFAAAVAIVFGIILPVAAAPPPAQAQIAPRPPPTPPATPSPANINSDLSAGAAVTNLGSNFLERLGNQASYGFSRALRNNPGGGGASEATDAPRFRTWAEAYGIWARTGAQGDFVGDRRQTWGGVGGLGARLAPASTSAFRLIGAIPRSTFR